MKRAFFGVFVALCVAVPLAACGDEHRHRGAYEVADCRQFTSCGSCTPVVGCGWCSTSNGDGLCTDQPNDCAGAQVFTWTWEASGCRAGADASVVATDAGTASDASSASDAPAGDGEGGVR